MPPFIETLTFLVLVLAGVGAVAILFAATTFAFAQISLSRLRARDALARRLWTAAQHAVALARFEQAGEERFDVSARAKVLLKVQTVQMHNISAAVGISRTPAALETWMDGLIQRVLIDEKRQERAPRKRPELREVPAEAVPTPEEKAS